MTAGSHNIYDKLRDPSAGFPAEGKIIKLGSGWLFGWGLAATTEGHGVEGWAPGAIFIQIDGAADDQVFINEGSVTSATWTAVGSVG